MTGGGWRDLRSRRRKFHRRQCLISSTPRCACSARRSQVCASITNWPREYHGRPKSRRSNLVARWLSIRWPRAGSLTATASTLGGFAARQHHLARSAPLCATRTGPAALQMPHLPETEGSSPVWGQNVSGVWMASRVRYGASQSRRASIIRSRTSPPWNATYAAGAAKRYCDGRLDMLWRRRASLCAKLAGGTVTISRPGRYSSRQTAHPLPGGDAAEPPVCSGKVSAKARSGDGGIRQETATSRRVARGSAARKILGS